MEEKIWGYILEQGLPFVILAIVIYFLYKEWKYEKAENKELQSYIRENDKANLKVLTDVTQSLKSLTEASVSAQADINARNATNKNELAEKIEKIERILESIHLQKPK